MSDVVEYAKKQRHAALLEKVKSGKALSTSELRELEEFEEMAKKQAKNKPKSTKKENSTPELTPKMNAFCYEFAATDNQTKSYKKVYGCSEGAAAVGAHRLLKKAKIQKKLSEIRSKAIQKSEVTLQRVIDEISKIAFSNIRGCIDSDATGFTFNSAKEIPDDLWPCISEIGQLPGGRVKVKLYSKTRALDSLKEFFVENPGKGDNEKKIIKSPLSIPNSKK